MNNFNNFSIRSKLLVAFFLIFVVFSWFIIYLLIILDNLQTAENNLNKVSKNQILFSKITEDTSVLSDSVKSYIITKDPSYERLYDQTAFDFSNRIREAKLTQEADEIKILSEINDDITKARGVELLIFLKTREGSINEAIQLFDKTYFQLQQDTEKLSNQLKTIEKQDFETALTKHNTILKDTRIFLIIGIVINLILNTFVAIYFSSRITNSLNVLVATVQKFAKGDLSERARILSNDEIGKLSLVFNIMADRINDYYQELENKIKEKTAQLADKVREIDEARLKDEAILASVGEGMIATDKDGVIIKINRIANELIGISDNVGKSVFDVVIFYDEQGAKVEKEKQPAYKALQSGSRVEGAFEVRRPNGIKRVIHITSSPVAFEEKRIGVIIILSDITKEREIDKMKSEFISLASHQLRTPLSSIRWYLELLLGGRGGSGAPNDRQKEYLSVVNESNIRMIELVNSLLNVSRIELGTFMIEPAEENIIEIVDSVLTELTQPISEKNLKIEKNYDQSFPKMLVDKKLMRIIFQNLLTNAVKYTPPEGKIEVCVIKENENMLIKISDTGYGIPNLQKSRIFTKLFRADNVKAKETEGTGLGLYIIKSILDNSGGAITFDSEENKGTTFYVRLPLTGMKKKTGEKELEMK